MGFPVTNRPTKLLSFEFVGLCIIAFLAFCNVAVYYNLFNYLQSLGIQGDLCGLVIGAYSLTAMVLFLIVSPSLNAKNAPQSILLGIFVLVIAGFGYFYIHSYWGLLFLRIFNGLGQFLLSAGVMTLFVSIIPLEKSGQAFGLYSVAILLPYGGVPTLMDALSTHIPTPPHGYALATLFFLPGAWIILKIRSRSQKLLKDSGKVPNLSSWGNVKENFTEVRVPLLLLTNLSYFTLWGSIFFLFKGFATQLGLTNVGSFFAVQTGLMIVIRILAGRLFDSMNKVWLMVASFLLIASGYLTLDHLSGTWAIPLVALLFGVGMGVGYPAINGKMFEISAPQFRSVNANLMLFAVQGGFFFGPVIGGALVARQGYHGYFLFCITVALVTALISSLLNVSPETREA